MPNGKSQFDCCYCVHFESEYEGSDAMYDAGFCKFHNAEIPTTSGSGKHRICRNFQASDHYDFYLQFLTIEQRFELFERSLQENILYEFPYNLPSEIKKLKDL